MTANSCWTCFGFVPHALDSTIIFLLILHLLLPILQHLSKNHTSYHGHGSPSLGHAPVCGERSLSGRPRITEACIHLRTLEGISLGAPFGLVGRNTVFHPSRISYHRKLHCRLSTMGCTRLCNVRTLPAWMGVSIGLPHNGECVAVDRGDPRSPISSFHCNVQATAQRRLVSSHLGLGHAHG